MYHLVPKTWLLASRDDRVQGSWSREVAADVSRTLRLSISTWTEPGIRNSMPVMYNKLGTLIRNFNL